MLEIFPKGHRGRSGEEVGWIGTSGGNKCIELTKVIREVDAKAPLGVESGHELSVDNEQGDDAAHRRRQQDQ